MTKNRSRKFRILIPLLVLVLLPSLMPCLPAVLASSKQLQEIGSLSLSTTTPDIEWEKTFGGSGNDAGYSVQQTSDGGFIIAGYTSSSVSTDVYLVRTDASGNRQWSKTFGDSDDDVGYSVQQTSDGGFIIVGKKWYDNAGSDVHLIKTDASGNQQWSKNFGGLKYDYDEGCSVQQTSDGSFIIAASTDSFGAGGDDVYLVKIAAEGVTPTPTPTPSPTQTPTPTPSVSISSPQLITPENGATITDNTPLFTWTGIAEAREYWLQIASDSDFNTNSKIIDITMESFNTEYAPVIHDAGTYYWRIKALNNDSESPWSSTLSFNIATSAEQKTKLFPLWIIGAVGGGLSLIAVILMLIRRNNKRMAKVSTINVRTKQFKSQMEQWRSEGYDVSSLKDLFK